MAKEFSVIKSTMAYLLYTLTTNKRINKLPPSVRRIIVKPIELNGSLVKNRKECIKLLDTLLHKLLMEQYYVLNSQRQPLLIKTIRSIVAVASTNVFMNTYKLIKQNKEGLDIRKEYPDLRARLRRYAKFDEPVRYLGVEDREDFSSLDQEEWWDFREKENNEMFGLHDWKIQKMEDFMSVCHNVLYQMFSDIRTLDKTPLLIYATNIFEEYLPFCRMAERMQKVVDYGLPAEAINLPVVQFSDLISRQPAQKQEFVEGLKHLRRWGDKV